MDTYHVDHYQNNRTSNGDSYDIADLDVFDLELDGEPLDFEDDADVQALIDAVTADLPMHD